VNTGIDCNRRWACPASLAALIVWMLVSAGPGHPFLGTATRVFALGEKVVEEAFVVFRSGGARGYHSLMQHATSLRLGNAGTAELVLRVAAKDGRITAQEAETLYASLREVPGFANTAKWLLVGEKTSKQLIGSLQELRIAGNLQKSGYKVVELRKTFLGDPAKVRADIDLIVEKGGKRFAIESKAWGHEAQWDQIALDAGTLKAYEKLNPGTISYFLFKQQPSPLVVKKLEDNGIRHLIVGDLDALKYLEL